MEVPSKFPPGCKFWASFFGDEFVVFPDGSVACAADDGGSLVPRKVLPSLSPLAPISKAAPNGES